MKYFPFVLVLAILVFNSCTPHRQMVYMQDLYNKGNQLTFIAPEYILRPGDILNVRVLTLDEESRELFNAAPIPGIVGGASPNANFFVTGFSIDAEGFIELPVAGKIKVASLSLNDATEAIQAAVDRYLVDATVDVKLVNFAISVLGEVRRPGHFYIYENKITIIDAIGMAGDLTEFGNRNITLLRRTGNGVTFHTIDLNSRNFITSDLFFLHPGDLIYVEPKPIKQLGFAQFPFGVLFSAITTTLVLINFLSQ